MGMKLSSTLVALWQQFLCPQPCAAFALSWLVAAVHHLVLLRDELRAGPLHGPYVALTWPLRGFMV